ncbi:MAG: hypothetical protein K8J31_28640 [Anaerolineae bacterium]|nr:hypothetical protein [Anaerolineae bacterium]
MPWRMHLSNRALQRLDIVPGTDSAVLAAWTQPGRVSYLDLETGTLLGDRRFADLISRQPERWLLLQPDLVTPSGGYLPLLSGSDVTVHVSQNAQLRLYHQAGKVSLVSVTQETEFDPGGTDSFRVAALSRATGLAGAITQAGCLHLYREHGLLGVYEIGLGTLNPETLVAMTITTDMDKIFVAADRCLLHVDANGQVIKRQELHYPIGAFASSGTGRYLACSDRETNVIRVYQGTDLTPVHQRHALDLMATATQVQLIADPPPSMVALNVLAVDDDGLLAFALAGVICVTHFTHMLAFPRLENLVSQEPQ